MPPSGDMKEILRLTQENNKMLHSMRRGSLVKTFLQLVFYAAMILIPLWLYMEYLAPVVNKMMQTVQQVQGTGAEVSAQFGGLQDMLKSFSEKIQIPGAPQN